VFSLIESDQNIKVGSEMNQLFFDSTCQIWKGGYGVDLFPQFFFDFKEK
jgi:hypothetical protein